LAAALSCLVPHSGAPSYPANLNEQVWRELNFSGEVMPELPEVEALRRRLANCMLGKKFSDIGISGARLRVPVAQNLPERLRGRMVASVRRRAKYILIDLSGNCTLVVHLGMSGCFLFRYCGDPVDAHDHAIFDLDDGVSVRFNDRRRFGLIALIAADAEADLQCLARLGPEPFEARFNEEYLAARLKGRRQTIKAALLDQSLVGGIGNIYSCEILYVARIDPAHRASSLSPGSLSRLVRACRCVLRDAIVSGGATLDDYRGTPLEMGDFDRKFSVFQRAGKPCPECRCDHGVIRTRVAGRVTYFCPVVQRD
jgi:formamidopyrimidine-DNA glycosylase